MCADDIYHLSEKGSFVLFAWDEHFADCAEDCVRKALDRNEVDYEDQMTRRVPLLSWRVSQCCGRILTQIPTELVSMMAARLGQHHLPESVEDMVMLYVVNPLVDRVRRSEANCPSEELRDTISPTVVEFLERVESDTELYQYGDAAYWAEFALLHFVHGVPEWCAAVGGRLGTRKTARLNTPFQAMRLGLTGGQEGDSGCDFDDLGQRMKNAVGAGENDHVFFHGTSGAVVEGVIDEPWLSRTGRPDFGPRFYTSRDPAVAAQWAWQRFHGALPPVVIAYVVPPQARTYHALDTWEKDCWYEALYAYYGDSDDASYRLYQGYNVLEGLMKQNFTEPFPTNKEDFMRRVTARTIGEREQVQSAFDDFGVRKLRQPDVQKLVFVLGDTDEDDSSAGER
jgi:hypothetical protein